MDWDVIEQRRIAFKEAKVELTRLAKMNMPLNISATRFNNCGRLSCFGWERPETYQKVMRNISQ